MKAVRIKEHPDKPGRKKGEKTKRKGGHGREMERKKGHSRRKGQSVIK